MAQRRNQIGPNVYQLYVSEYNGLLMSRPRYSEICQTIYDIEDELSLFETELRGVKLWERIRFPVFATIINDEFNRGQNNDISVKEIAVGSARSALDIPTIPKDTDVLIWCNCRRKLQNDGNWLDIYTGYLNEKLSIEDKIEHANIEKPHGSVHHKPITEKNIYYIDLIYYMAAAVRTIAEKQQFSNLLNSPFPEARARLKEELGIDIDIQSLVKRDLAARSVCKPLFRMLLKRASPEAALITINYGFMKKTFIEICKEMDITVIELQHGVIYPNHLGYFYTKDRSNIYYFPDRILTWGEYWSNSVDFPLPESNIHSVGYPHIDEKLKEYTNIESDSVLFISQSIIGDELSDMAVKFNEKTNKDVIYKLHPKEYDSWKNDYKSLLESDVRVVSEEIPLYQLFSQVGNQVGVFSTALYEGFAFDLRTYLVDLPGVETMESLANEYSIPIVDSVESLSYQVNTLDKSEFNSEIFFEPNAVKNIFRVISEVTSR